MAADNLPKRFADERYLIIRSLLVEPMLSIVGNYALQRARFGRMVYDDVQAPNTPSAYGDPMMETLLVELQPALEGHVGLRLFPTYAYFRVYKNGDVLVRHRDRPSCEISATLTLRYAARKTWPILLESPNGTVAADLEPGDAMIYRGCECEHWRESFDGEECAQVFLHYVDADGPNAEWRFDKRERLNTQLDSEATDAR